MKDCKLWTLAKNNHGYGVVRRKGKNHYIHRLTYAETHGEIPAGMVVRHSCDTPACYEIEHLVLGSQGDNMADMRTRGRHKWGERPKGEGHGSTVLTEDQVRAIRGDGRSARQVAAVFGISKTHVLNIRNRKAWTHLT